MLRPPRELDDAPLRTPQRVHGDGGAHCIMGMLIRQALSELSVCCAQVRHQVHLFSHRRWRRALEYQGVADVHVPR
jgi:hypothetical protein